MPSIDQALKDLNDAANAWAEAAKKLKEAQEWRDMTHERSEKLREAWLTEPGDTNREALTRNYEVERDAEREQLEAFEAYQAALAAYLRALAEFQAALVQSLAR